MLVSPQSHETTVLSDYDKSISIRLMVAFFCSYFVTIGTVLAGCFFEVFFASICFFFIY